MRVFVDARRPAPSGWALARRKEDAIALLRTGEVEEISLAYRLDLGPEDQGTGYDVILWIERAVIERSFAPPAVTIHDADGAQRERMIAGVRSIERAVQSFLGRKGTSS